MVVLRLNENGIWLLTGLLTFIITTMLIFANISFMTILIMTPLLIGINLIISSNLKIAIKKELVKPAKVQN